MTTHNAIVHDCGECPFYHYNGGGHECQAPVRWPPSPERCHAALLAGKIPRGCPLKPDGILVSSELHPPSVWRVMVAAVRSLSARRLPGE